MIAPRYVYLTPKFEDEGTWDDRGWIEYPGRPFAAVLTEILQNLGCETEPVDSEGEKGWAINFSYRKVRHWTRVGKIEDFLIVFRPLGSFDFSGRKKRAFDELLSQLERALAEDGRFDNIRWYTQQQMDDGEWDYPGKGDVAEAGS